jgi:ubiquinone biosynthesis protein
MNALSFIHLMSMIFSKKQANLEAIQRKGLLAVKIAQTFALRADFLSHEQCTHLAQLYSSTLALPSEDVFKLIDEHTTQAWRDQFEWIDPNPIGSASVGQVHRARLKTQEEVVIKVIKKDFTKDFKKDVLKLDRLMRVAIFFYPKLAKVADPIGIINYIKEYTLAELDLRNEIAHGKILRDIYDQNKQQFDLSRLGFPKVYESLSSEKILVTEFLDGPTVDEILPLKVLSNEDILEIFRLHGFYMYHTGTFHGDLHPGNMIYKDNKFYFIDTGAIAHVEDKIRFGLFSFMSNLSHANYEGCARSLNEMAFKGIEGKKLNQYIEGLKNLYKDFEGKTVSEESLTKKMMQTIKLGVESGMEFEKDMFAIIKSHMYMDGIVLKGNPDSVLMKDVGKFIEEFKEMVYGD